MANYQNILRQAHQAIADVADNADSWRAFLRSAAYTTHYAFPNQALIYSQRPGATMLADIDTWNRAAGRWVNRGAHGVASLGTGNMAGNVRYLFDIKDTHPAGKDSKPLGWQITDANRYPTLQTLQEKHNAESLPEIFGLQAALFVAQHGKQLDADLQNAVIGSTLEWAKPQEQTAIFANLITQSAVYMAAVRCGLGDSAVPQDAFADIDRFDTESAVLALGNAVNRAGRQMFAEIGAVVKSIDSVAKTQPKQYDENVSSWKICRMKSSRSCKPNSTASTTTTTISLGSSTAVAHRWICGMTADISCCVPWKTSTARATSSANRICFQSAPSGLPVLPSAWKLPARRWR